MPKNKMSEEYLETLIPKILEDEENVKGFVFFFNRLENIHRPLIELKLALEKHLLICNDEKNEGLLNAATIQIIANAVLNNTGIKVAISIHEFKSKYRKSLLRNDEWGAKYRELAQSYEEGDEIFELISPRWTWKQLCGYSFVALERKGEAVVIIRKSMS